MMRTGRTGGGRGADGRTEADGRTGERADCGGRADGRRTWGKGEADGRTGGQADERMRADGARIGRTSGRANGQTSRGFKRPRTSFPASLSSAQTTRLTAERVCRALGSALGS